MTNTKSKLYEDLIRRFRATHDSGFHYESCWFAYAIFEDRLSSIVKQSGDGRGANSKFSDKISQIDELKKMKIAMIKKNGFGAVRDKAKGGKKVKQHKFAELSSLRISMLSELKDWSQSRNDLVHDLASGTKTLEVCDAEIKELSTKADELIKEVCATARRVKRNKRKQSTAQI